MYRNTKRAPEAECFVRVHEYERSATVSSSESDGELPASRHCDDETCRSPDCRAASTSDACGPEAEAEVEGGACERAAMACICDCDEEAAGLRRHELCAEPEGAGVRWRCAATRAAASHSLLATRGNIDSACA